MAITPNTNLKILKVPITIDNLNQLTFTNKEDQYNYFNNLQAIEIEDISYQRKDNVIRFPQNIDSILEYNYVMYQNENYTNKWFYGFITNMEYINDNMTYIYIKTDVFQTWQFDLNYKQSFIEREHVNDDTIGLHTIPENLETGEYTNHDDTTLFGIGTCHAVVCTTEDPFRQDVNYPYNIVNSIPSGLHYFVVGDFTSVNFIGWLTDWASKNSDLSLIQSIFLVPDSMTGYDNSPSSSYWSYALNEAYAPYHKLPTRIIGSIDMGNTTINKAYNNIDGFIPHNNKLFVYPYNFLMIDNNGGSSYEYRYEDFEDNNCTFTTRGAITPGCSIKTTPRNYKHIDYNYSESINALKLPIGSWEGDTYTNWLTQNAVNIGLGIFGSGLEIFGGASMIALGGGALAGAGTIVSASSEIINQLNQVYQHSKIPNQIYGNTNSGDVTYADNHSTFTIYRRTIKKEYAIIIDNFFEVYGYLVNSYKLPNLTGRKNWNYIKTIGINITGNIPQNDLQEIKAMFNNGLTLWHNPNTFLDYTQDNSIL